jgi:hypothetical protein
MVVSYEWGKHIYDVDPEFNDPTGLLSLIVGTLVMLGAAWSKTSFAITVLRVAESWIRVFLWFAIISMNLFMTTAAVFQWVQCTPLKKVWAPWKYDGHCLPSSINLGLNMSATGMYSRPHRERSDGYICRSHAGS